MWGEIAAGGGLAYDLLLELDWLRSLGKVYDLKILILRFQGLVPGTLREPLGGVAIRSVF